MDNKHISSIEHCLCGRSAINGKATVWVVEEGVSPRAHSEETSNSTARYQQQWHRSKATGTAEQRWPGRRAHGGSNTAWQGQAANCGRPRPAMAKPGAGPADMASATRPMLSHGKGGDRSPRPDSPRPFMCTNFKASTTTKPTRLSHNHLDHTKRGYIGLPLGAIT